MRWEISYSAAVLAGIFSGTCAFAPAVSRPRIRSLGVGQGWDNEDFLGALGKGSDEIDAANEQYRAQSRYEPGEQAADEVGGDDSANGAELTSDMIEKVKSSHDEDEERYGGGSMFKNLMARAQSGQMLRPNTPPPPPPAASSAVPPVSLENMSVEEQARMFREMMQQQQQQPVAPPPVASTPPPVVQKALQPFPQAYPPQGVPLAPDGRKIGRNRDADAIVNSADVYFAQLKTDSTSRVMARIRGDDETANKVWHDPHIQEIEVYVNPYLKEAKKKEQEMLETSADELLIPISENERKVLDRSFTGVSYKDRLRNRGKKSSSGSAPAPAAPVAAAPVVAPPAPAPVESTPVAPPAPETTNPVAVSATPPAPVAPAPVAPPAVAAPVPSPPQPVATGDLRKDIRTTQGLLIKHRGGPGFGSGRLRGNDIQKFEGLAKEVTGSLRQEAAGTAAQAPPPPAVSAPATAPLAPPAAAAAVGDSRAASMIACVSGAVLLYKNSPPELQESVLVTLRAALVSAVNTCNDLLADNDTIPASAATSSSVPAMLACLEGAVQLYENSPPELQASVLATLRAALLAAVSTCNIAIAENEVQNVQDYQAATGAGPAAMPTDFHDVAVPEEAPAPTNVVEALSVDDPNAKILERVYQKLEKEDAAGAQASVSEALSGDDSNSQILESVFQKLQNAAGDGKMGLRSDLPPSDAQVLADDLVEMRSLLVDELQNGVPAEAPVAASASSSSGSLYKKMLAKARADKEKGQ